MAHAVSDIIDHLSELPPFPKVTSKLLVMLDDESVAIEELSGVISSDPSLVVKVLHLANSPFYMTGKSIESVKEAVMVLGISTIKSITTAASLQKGLLAVRPRTDAFNMLDYWRHSYATAIAASKIARKRNRRTADTLYVVGLIHDIGKVIIAYYWPEVWRAIVASVKNGDDYSVAESRLFGWTQAQIGARLCTNWQFPSPIVQLVDDSSLDADRGANEPVTILATAHSLVSQAGYGFPATSIIQPPQEELPTELQQISDDLHLDVEYQLKVLES